jgi:hypothetical protein
MFSCSLHRFIRRVVRSRGRNRRSLSQTKDLFFKPQLLLLENRLAPSTINWTGANHLIDNNWSDGSNWQGGVAPGAGDIANFTSAGTKSFTSNVDKSFHVAGITIDGTWNGTINVNSSLSVSGNFSLASGTVAGNGAVSIGGSGSQWTGGQIDLGTGGFTNNGTLTIDYTHGSLILDSAGTFTNNGTINEATTLFLEDGATLSNAGGATYDFTNDANVSESGGGTLSNAGTVEKTGGTHTSFITSTFNNTGGTIDAESGTLVLDSAGGTINGGALDAGVGGSTSAVLDLTTSGTTVEYAGTFTGSGSGTVSLGLGTLAVTSAGATFQLPGSLFQWTDGYLDLSSGGTVTNAATGVLNLNTQSDDVFINGPGTLVNDGTINEAGGNTLILEHGATLSNVATLDFTDNANISTVNGYGTGTFTNYGTLEKTGGTGFSTIGISTLSNTGSLAVHSGTLTVTAPVTQITGSTLTAGSWSVFGSSTVPATLTIGSAGSLTTIGAKAHVTLSGPNSTFTNIDGMDGLTTIRKGGSFSVRGGRAFTTAGGLSNAGSVILSNGMLNITGTVAQLSGHALTGGTWSVGVGSHLKFPTGSEITSLAGATVSLIGSTSNFAALAGLATVGSTSSFSLLGGRSFTALGAFTDNGKVTLGPNSVLTANGSFRQASTATLSIEIGGTSAAPTFGQVASTSGTVTLAGNLTVTCTVIPTVGTAFEILDNGGNAAVVGAFAGLTEGATFTVVGGTTTMTFQVTYVGTDTDGSNNVIITRIS